MSMKRFFIALFLLFAAPVFAAEGEIPYVTAATFEAEVAGATAPVLVQFDAAWCPYCRAMQPALKKLHESDTRLKIVKIDADTDRDLMKRFGVKTLPTMIVFSNGAEHARRVGRLEEEALFEWADQVSKEFK